jgi:PAS domain S-box-containing protein
MAHEAKVQDALYRIAELASAAEDMQAFYRASHEIVGELMYAENFFIALYDAERNLVNWPYYVGDREWRPPPPSEWIPFTSARGATGYVLRTEQPQLLPHERFHQLIQQGEIELQHVMPEGGTWLGVPLKSSDGRPVGVLVVQSYSAEHTYTERDRDLLAFVGQHIGTALSRARAIEETRQRNAELALINSVQDAIAGEFDQQAIYDAVGGKIQEIFDSQGVSIRIVDWDTGLVSLPYLSQRGERFQSEPHPLGAGFTGHVLETRESLLINEDSVAEAERYGSVLLAPEMPKSMLFVPLVSGALAIGVIAIENFDREHAFDPSDVRLLETLAGSLSVALENARLVHETRQRNAELALINSVQAAIAGELDQQAIYDTVGDKIRDIFDAQGVAISIIDETAGLVRFPYILERGERLEAEPRPLGGGFTQHVLETCEPLLINEDFSRHVERHGGIRIAGEEAKSALFVPLLTGDRATGVITLENLDREHAFTESDVRLLTTLAGSLTVALENARLVHETRQRNAELALINTVQEALAGELEMQAIYDVVGDKIQEIFDAQVVDIGIFDFAAGMVRFPYAIERGVRYPDEPAPFSARTHELIATKAPMLIGEVPAHDRERGEVSPVIQGEPALSVIVAPLISGDEVRGRISLQNLDRTNAFSESDLRLLTTLAGSLSVALDNARLVDETRQRNAELALINSVQDALAGELEMQAIYDVVGDKIGEVFDVQGVSINVVDETTGLMHFPYLIERGERLHVDPRPLRKGGFAPHVLETREPLLINEDLVAEVERYGSELVAGEMEKSVLFVPLITGARATGVIALSNFDREHAFEEADQRLLTTLAGSLSVALENARLVHETRQRNAELALINSVQEAIAGELDQQAIFDAVGDRIREIFEAQVVSIVAYEAATGLMHFPYIIERGERLEAESRPLRGFTKHVIETKQPLLIVENLDVERERYGSRPVAGEAPKSILFVPLVSGNEATGVLSLQNVDREHAFGESDQQLLETLAGSLSVALENARLVHETRQRNAELALINTVQESIAGELDQQAIYEAVGDRIRDVFDAQVVSIATVDEASELMHTPYIIERGIRLEAEPRALGGFSKHVVDTGEALLITENLDEESERYGSSITAGESTKSVLFVPLVTGGRTTGVISLQNIDREHAFGESDQRLLTTLAGSLSVALENARLVHETRQRNAELALINSVQSAIAGELEAQAIYDLVGDRIRDVFEAQVVSISSLDEAAGLLHYPYVLERGERLQAEAGAPLGFSKHVLETRESLLITENVDAEAERYGSVVMEGERVKSVLFVPLVSGGKATGTISLQNADREHAFSDSDRQLLETLAGSLSVALENARLVHETRQRNAELALINSVQDAIAGELDQQAIYDAVGDRIREIFDAQGVSIRILDRATGLLSFPYLAQHGKRFEHEPLPLEAGAGAGFSAHVLQTRQPLLINENFAAEFERYGSRLLQPEAPKSILLVPLLAGAEAIGVVALENYDREYAFSASDQQLLETLAGSLSVALENARLVHETRQRNAELALINSVQESIAGELDPQAIYDSVGEKIRRVFDAQVVTIATLDEATGLIQYPYFVERGERLRAETQPLSGFTKHVLETREPLLLVENLAAESERFGSEVVAGEMPKSVLFVPLVAGGKATGVISLQNIDREHAFGEPDQQLLMTVAGSLSVALENARLVQETRQRVSELATVNSVGHAIASLLELDALIELVGEHVRETFEADLAFVALHDRTAGRIDFAYYHERGERRDEPSIPFGEGLTSRIIESREPLLLNRSAQFEDVAQRVGTMVRSFLGVPILVGERAIGAISVQSIEEEGRFGQAEMRLLSTIAANVGVAIQNARLFTEVERQRGYLESLVSITPAAVVVLDADERVTDWNPAAAELFGYSAEEAVGRPIDDLVFGETENGREEGRELMAEAVREGRAQRITRRRRRDGTLVDVELMLVPLTVDGAHAGFLGVYHDVTELQRARQEAEAATQAKSAFLATMSHEIRTPMNAVIGMTDLLLSTDLTGEQREFAEIVHSSGDALLHVIDDILDYSKIEAGKLDLEHEPFRLRDCVEGALDIVAPRAWEKGIELGCLIDEAAPAGILGDEARLRQVLLNLLSNGVKFTEEGGEVFVLVDAEARGGGACRIELSVRDTGIGIPQDRMDRLFTSFSQVDASTTRRFGGTGLGLAISKRLVELMGGAISVESEKGAGSTFRISLPVTEAEVPSPIPLEEGLPQLAGKRILVVDDNETNREIVSRHARSWGMEPLAVERPSEALALVDAGEAFDVGVLDMMMPDMDGLALAGEIRSRRSADELPLLLLTSLGRIPQAESGSIFSAQLTKPLKASQLYNTLLQLLTAEDVGAETVDAETNGQPARPSFLRILLAEDNPMNQKVALRLLERMGYTATVAWNGLEAIAALERQPFDVVLMDVQMPELDGLDATRRICEQWPAERRPHIIAMTANALPEDREACFAAGMNDYVAKPIRAEELARALKRAKPIAASPDENSEEANVDLDAAALRNLRDLGGDEFLAEVVDAFLSDAPELMATLRRSLDEQNAEELRRAAHTLKSNGSTLGAAQFAELCRVLEQRAKEGELEGSSELIDRIEQEYGSLEESLAALRAEPAL